GATVHGPPARGPSPAGSRSRGAPRCPSARPVAPAPSRLGMPVRRPVPRSRRAVVDGADGPGGGGRMSGCVLPLLPGAATAAAGRGRAGVGARPAVRARRRAAVQLPCAVDLLQACLDAGAAPGRAMSAVAAAVGEPLERPLRAVVSAVAIGASPVTAWADVG